MYSKYKYTITIDKISDTVNPIYLEPRLEWKLDNYFHDWSLKSL